MSAALACRVLAGCLAAALALAGAGAGGASAAGGPRWIITSAARPSHLAPGTSAPASAFVVTATNVGEKATTGPIKVVDHLPSGFKAVLAVASEAFRFAEPGGEDHAQMPCKEEAAGTVETCEFAGKAGEKEEGIAPGDSITVAVYVSVPASPEGPTATNEAIVSGGGAETAATGEPTTTPTPLDSAQSGFGAFGFFFALSGDQAGGHPNATTAFSLNESGPDQTDGNVRDVSVQLPAGMIGNPTAVPECTSEAVTRHACPSEAAVGVATSEVVEHPGSSIGPPFGHQMVVSLIYKVKAGPGEPAAFEFATLAFPVRLDTALRRDPDGQYRVHVTAHSIVESGSALDVSTTFWGVPAEHNGPGPWEATANEEEALPRKPLTFGGPGGGARTAFLSLPTACAGDPLTADLPPLAVAMAVDSWQEPGGLDESGLPDLTDGHWHSLEAPLPEPEGCDALTFTPSITVAPANLQAGAPAGYTVDLHVPQPEEGTQLATPDLENAVVALPAGTIVSPASANGLEGCSEEQFDVRSQGEAACPAGSQIGTVKVKTPLLSEPLEGQLFLATPACSPCSPQDAQEGRMIRLMLQAQGSGVRVKLRGTVSVDPGTGRLTTTFDENPQLPFEDLSVVLKSGSTAALANPSQCGVGYLATASLTPYSSPVAATPTSIPFQVTGCPPVTPFAPTFTGGTTTNQAASFSPFVTTFSRPDQNQILNTIQVTVPPGLLGLLASVPLCGEAQANAGSCPAASQIGHTVVAAGPGSTPFYVPEAGQPQAPVYLTGPYGGGPFGLSVVVPAIAGPFNLGTVVVRASIKVDPNTGQVTITSNPLPTSLDGIQLQVRTVNVTIDRPGFMFNPTSCTPKTLSATITSTAGASSTQDGRFQADACASLSFKTSFTASTSGRTSRLNGASLDVRVSSHQGPGATGREANIAKVDVQLPSQLPSRLETLQKACTRAQFSVNPAGCPSASDVGFAVAHTPVLPVPLEGPAYLVARGGAQFPDLVVVLQGDGVLIDLTGATEIKKGVTYSHFETVPDAPVSSFELKLPERRFSALSAPASLCKRTTTVSVKKRVTVRVHGRWVHVTRTIKEKVVGPLSMPTTIVGQNGAVIRQTTKIAVVGCPMPRARRATVHHRR